MPWKHCDGDEDNERWQEEDENDEISCGHWWTRIEQQGQCWRMKGMVMLVMEDEGDDKDEDDNGCDMRGQHGSIGEVGGWDGTKGMMRDVKGYDKKYEWWKKMGDVRDGDGKKQGWKKIIGNDGVIYYGQCDRHHYFHKILPIYSYCHLISMFFSSLLNFHDIILTLSNLIVASYHSSNQSHCFKDVWQHLIKGDAKWKHPNLEVWWMLGPFSPPPTFCFVNSPWNFVCMDQINHLIWWDFFSKFLNCNVCTFGGLMSNFYDVFI